MMLETTSRALFEEPGQVHYGSPDKDPALRLAVIEDAGRERVPVHHRHPGRHRRDAARPRRVARRPPRRRTTRHGPRAGGHRAELPREAAAPRCRARPDAVAARVRRRGRRRPARARARACAIQVPPNLSDPAEFDLLVRAGADDWGGVSPLTADHVNPERPWPHLDDLAARTAELGLRRCASGSPRTPSTSRDAETWIDPALHARGRGARRPGDRAWPRRGAVGAPARRRPARRTALERTAGATDPVPALCDARSVAASAASPSAPRPTRCASTTPSGSRCCSATGDDLDALDRDRRRRAPLHRRRGGEPRRQPQPHLDAASASAPTGEPGDLHARRRRRDRVGCLGPRRHRALRAGPAARDRGPARATSTSPARSRRATPAHAPARLPAAGRLRPRRSRRARARRRARGAARGGRRHRARARASRCSASACARSSRRATSRSTAGSRASPPRIAPGSARPRCSSTATSRPPRSASRTCGGCARSRTRPRGFTEFVPIPLPGPPAASRSSPAARRSTSTARWSPSRGCC